MAKSKNTEGTKRGAASDADLIAKAEASAKRAAATFDKLAARKFNADDMTGAGLFKAKARGIRDVLTATEP